MNTDNYIETTMARYNEDSIEPPIRILLEVKSTEKMQMLLTVENGLEQRMIFAYSHR